MRSRTMLIFKPDCLSGQGGVGLDALLGEVAEYGTEFGMRMEMAARIQLSKEMAARLYEEHRGKPFYDGLVGFMTSGPCLVSIWSCESGPACLAGREVVRRIREKHGRDDLSETGPANLVHGSDSQDSADREIRWAVKCFILRCAEEGG